MFLLYMIGFFLIPDSLAEYIEILTMGIVGYFIFFRKFYSIVDYVPVSMFIALLSIKNLNIYGNTLYALGGSDPLKYESWSQQILYFRSLQGGEDIFLYQPGTDIYYLFLIFYLETAMLQLLYL